MPETSEQSAPLELLSDQIQESFSWHRSRVKWQLGQFGTLFITTIFQLLSRVNHYLKNEPLAGEIMNDSFLITITTVNKKSCGLDELWEVNDEYGNTYEVKADQGFRWGTFTLRIPEELFKSIDWENTTDTIDFDEHPDYDIVDHSMSDGSWNDIKVLGEIRVEPEYFEDYDETEEDVRERIKEYLLENYYRGDTNFSHMWAIGPFELEVDEAPDWYWHDELLKKVVADDDSNIKSYWEYASEWVENEDVEIICNLACNKNTPNLLASYIFDSIDDLSKENAEIVKKYISLNYDFDSGLKEGYDSICKFVINNAHRLGAKSEKYINNILENNDVSLAILENIKNKLNKFSNKARIIINAHKDDLSQLMREGRYELAITKSENRNDFNSIKEIANKIVKDSKASYSALVTVYRSSDNYIGGEIANEQLNKQLKIEIIKHANFKLDAKNELKNLEDEWYIITFDSEDFDIQQSFLKNNTCPLSFLEHIVENIDDYENAEGLLKLITQHPNADDEINLTINIMNLCSSIEPEIDINYNNFNAAYQKIINYKNKIDSTYWWELVTDINNSINASLSVVGKTPDNCSFNSFQIKDYKENEKFKILFKMSELNLLEVNDDGFVTINDTNWDPVYNGCDTDDEKEEFIDLISEFMDGDFFKQNIDLIKTPFWISIHTYIGAFLTKILYFNGNKLFKYASDNYDWFDVIERLKIKKDIISKKVINKEDYDIDLDDFEISEDYLNKDGPSDLNNITHLLIREFWEDLK